MLCILKPPPQISLACDYIVHCVWYSAQTKCTLDKHPVKLTLSLISYDLIWCDLFLKSFNINIQSNAISYFCKRFLVTQAVCRCDHKWALWHHSPHVHISHILPNINIIEVGFLLCFFIFPFHLNAEWLSVLVLKFTTSGDTLRL